MTYYTSFILKVGSVLHVWQFDPLLYWQYPKFSSKILINAFLSILTILPRSFMKIVEEISSKANPFTRAQECFCFPLRCGNPYCLFVAKTHLSLDPSPDATSSHNSWNWLWLSVLMGLANSICCDCHSMLFPWAHRRESQIDTSPSGQISSQNDVAARPDNMFFVDLCSLVISEQVRNHFSNVFAHQRTIVHEPWKPPWNKCLTRSSLFLLLLPALSLSN